MDEATKSSPLDRAHNWVLALSVTCLGLTIVIGWMFFRLRQPADAATLARLDPTVREEAVSRLVAAGGGIWDSFPDPDVARVLQPNLEDGRLRGVTIRSNRYGLREKDFAVPKPEGTTRIVLLGDSFIFGANEPAENRLGLFLEEFIAARSHAEATIEVLHIGIGSWNILSEVAYLSRNLSNIQPDAVIQVLVSNDLDDTGDVRGFGAVADFSSQRREQTVSFYTTYPIRGLQRDFRKLSYLNTALGYESRRRYQDAARALERLEQLLTRSDIGYLAVLNWMDEPKIAAEYLLGDLHPRNVLYFPESFRRDPRFRRSAYDPHWSRAGHRRMAEILYGAIRDRGLLPELGLASWRSANDSYRTIRDEGWSEVESGQPLELSYLIDDVVSSVDFGSLDEQMGSQIYGGIDADGHVSPYAAVLLATSNGNTLRIEGRVPDRPEIADTGLEIWGDETLLTTLTLSPGDRIAVGLALPPLLQARPTFDVRMRADNYVYRPDDVRASMVFTLDRISVQSRP